VASVEFGLVGNAVLPALPEDAGPCASDGADRSGVVLAAGSRGGVFVLGPGVPVTGSVGEDPGRGSEAVVTAATEARDLLRPDSTATGLMPASAARCSEVG